MFSLDFCFKDDYYSRFKVNWTLPSHSSMNSHERNYRRQIIIKCGLLLLISIYPETHTSNFFQNVSLSIEIQQILLKKKYWNHHTTHQTYKNSQRENCFTIQSKTKCVFCAITNATIAPYYAYSSLPSHILHTYICRW